MPDNQPSQELSPEEKRAQLAKLLREKARTSKTEAPLAYNQKGMWFLYQLAPESIAYNVAFAMRTAASLNLPVLQESFQAILDRHPALRTTYEDRGEGPVQVIHGYQDINFIEVDASSWSDAELLEQVVDAYETPFDLERGPLLRVHLFSRPQAEHLLMFTLHHITFDAWSAWIVLEELQAIYAAKINASPLHLPELPYAYTDYIHWQKEMLAGPVGERLWAYWSAQLSGELPLLNLHTDRPRPAVQTFNGATIPFALPVALAHKVKGLAVRESVTLFTLLAAAFQVLLYRYTGQTDILVGSPTSGRERVEFARVVGNFVNMIVLRSDLAGNLSFNAYLKKVRQAVIEALTHQDFPFSLLIERLSPERDPSRSPIFQVSFGFQQAQRAGAIASLFSSRRSNDPGSLDLEFFALSQQEGQFDITLEMTEAGEALLGNFKYNTDLFDDTTIRRMHRHFENLLEQVVSHPERGIADLDFLTDQEKRQLFVEWNATQTENLWDRPAHILFEEQVQRSPDAPALVFGNRSYSYRQLNELANQLAHALRRRQVGPESLVGVYIDRSAEMIIGLLGILKAGACYLPLDPAYPEERIAFMLQDAGVRLALTTRRQGLFDQLQACLPEPAPQVICLDSDWQAIAHESPANPENQTHSDNLAYVIYTSGSTGVPKGVMVPHRGIGNLAQAQIDVFDIHPDSRVLQFAAFSFDASVAEIMVTLLGGACLVLAPRDDLMPGLPLTRLMNQQDVSVVTLPPSALAVMDPADFPRLRTLVSAGEACPAEAVSRWAPGRRFVNGYGPTETTVCATMAICEADGKAPPIGRPILNSQAFVLDAGMQPTPVGVPGELFIRSIGLARGYLNRPHLTAERFVPDPFSAEPGARLYRTGDLVRFLPDGSLEFLGRIDHQVKVRGFRVELGEIETHLGSHPIVRQSIVLALKDGAGANRLVAYVVPHQAETIQNPAPAIEALRRSLGEHLPDYMVPSIFIFLESMPLSPNGKINRRALPTPEQAGTTGAEYVAPSTPTQEKLVEIMAEVLGLPRLGVHDNFFELGGHSLLATQVVSRIHKAFAVELPLRSLFEAPTAANLAERIDTSRSADQITPAPSITAIPRRAVEKTRKREG
jgi:amino acid adenylation domain-containing protein